MLHDTVTGRIAAVLAAVLLATAGAVSAQERYGPVGPNAVVDMTPTVSAKHFQYWPGGGRHHQPIIVPYQGHL